MADDLEITPHSLVQINNNWSHSQKVNFEKTMAKVLGDVKHYQPGQNPSLEAAFVAVMKQEGRYDKWNSCRRA